MKMQKIEVRPARIDDDVAQIATCLYYTDPYIYPYLCNGDIARWIEMAKQCYTLPDNYYNYHNLTVALVDGKIAGVICAIECGKVYSFSQGLVIPPELADNVSMAEKGYFEPAAKENVEWGGYNILCVCVLEEFRRMGIGRRLMDWFLHSVEGSEVYLESISDNVPAIGLYIKSGFEIVKEYFGFEPSGRQLSCYLMCRRARR